MTQPSRARHHARVRLAGVKQNQSVEAPSLARCRSILSLSKCWCGSDLCRVFAPLAPLPFRFISVQFNLPLMSLPAARSYGIRERRPRQPICSPPGRPQGGSPPSLRPRTRLRHYPLAFKTSAGANHQASQVQAHRDRMTTVAFVAARECVSVPKLPTTVHAPALDAPVVLRSAASLFMHPEAGAGCLQGVSRGPASIPGLASSGTGWRRVSRATATVHVSSATPPRFRLRGWAIPQRLTWRLPPP